MDFDFGYSFGLPSVLSPFARLIPTFAGSQYGTIDTTYVAAADDTVEIKIATTSAGVKRFIIDGDSIADRAFIFVSATDKIEWNAAEITALTIDGVAATSGVTAAPNDGKIHIVLATLAVDARVGTISADYTGGQVLVCEMLSIKTSLAAGTVVDDFVFDSGSDTDQPSRGGGNNVSLTNFATTDWNRYTLQRNILHDAGTITEAWVGDNLLSAIDSGFDVGHGWTLTGGWSVSGGVATGDGVSVANIDLTVSMGQGESHMITFTVAGRSSGNMRPSLGSTNGTSTITNDTFKDVLTTTDGLGLVRLNGLSSTFDGNVDNVIVNKLLEVA